MDTGGNMWIDDPDRCFGKTWPNLQNILSTAHVECVDEDDHIGELQVDGEEL